MGTKNEVARALGAVIASADDATRNKLAVVIEDWAHAYPGSYRVAMGRSTHKSALLIAILDVMVEASDARIYVEELV